MELKNLCFGGHTYRVLEIEEDGEVKLFLLNEIDLEAMLYAMPCGVAPAANFRCVN